MRNLPPENNVDPGKNQLHLRSRQLTGSLIEKLFVESHNLRDIGN